MNDEYTRINSKVILESTDGKKKVIDYCNKIDEILIQENLVEQLKNKIEKVSKELLEVIDLKNKSKKELIKDKIITESYSTLLLAGYTIFIQNILLFNIFKILNILLIIIDLFYIGYFAKKIYNNIQEYQEKLGTEKGLDSELKYLNLILEKEQEKLKELNKEKDIKTFSFSSPKDIVESKTIDNASIEEYIERIQEFYYDCGLNGEEYYEYYKKGLLELKLQDSHTKLGIDMLESYLNENKEIYEAQGKVERKGPILTRIKNRKSKKRSA